MDQFPAGEVDQFLSGRSSGWGLAYLACLALAAIGLVTRPSRERRGLTRAALALLALVLVARVASVGAGGVALRTTSGGSRPIDRLLDERDVALAGARVLALGGTMRDGDLPVLFDAMRDGYDRMRADAGSVPSPFVATYLGLESATDADVLEMGPPESDAVVVFLHGFAGSFTLPCWQMGQTVRALGVRTVCPATGWRGDWWSSEGEAIVRSVVAAQRARGARALVLAGLSNGGIGASRLAARLPGDFAAVILVSGVAPDAPAPKVPTLVLQGSADAAMPASAARAWSAASGARYVELDAAHFALLVRHEDAERAIRAFLEQAVPARPAQARQNSPTEKLSAPKSS